MEWWQDPFSRKIRIKEVIKLWYFWVPDFLLILIVIISTCFLLNSAITKTSLNIIINSIVIPAALSILISIVPVQLKKWEQNSEWTEREVLVYRDLLETFTKILISFHRDFDNFLEPPILRGFDSIQDLLQSIENLKTLIAPRTEVEFKNYNQCNISDLISKLTVQYSAILANNCTNSAVNLYYTIIMTHLIKLDESIKQTSNLQLKEDAYKDVYIQLNNYLESLPFLYKIIYPIVEKGMELNKMKHDINYYNQKMFENTAQENSSDYLEVKQNALKKAWATRNFEIDLYWKRATYFWVFNTTVAVAVFYIYTKINSNLILIPLVLLGFACSLAWCLSNLASKHWQENWENHIKLLEDSVYGRLYKTTITDYEYAIKPSVTRLNLKISVLVVLAWLIVFTKLTINLWTSGLWIQLGVLLIGIIAMILFMLLGEINDIKEFKTIASLLFKNKTYKSLYIKSGTIDNINIEERNN